jgi:DNA invertase Pin-like site-specific DNA recombinase
MLKDASRRKFDNVMAWAIDRLGRSLITIQDSETVQRLASSSLCQGLDGRADGREPDQRT